MFQKIELQEYGTTTELPSTIKRCCGAVIFSLCIVLIALLFVGKSLPSVIQVQVWNKLSDSGVENPVTAVLLNFRSYDTLLEIAVLLIVAVALLPSDDSVKKQGLVAENDVEVDLVTSGLLRFLLPTLVVVAGYMLWTGAYSPGGAFQAGALLASAGVLVSLAGRHHFVYTSLSARLLLTIGLVVFISVAAAVVFSTGSVLHYPIEFSGVIILLIEGAATLSIASTLLLLYISLIDSKTVSA